MKSRRRHAALEDVVDPAPFDYTLLSHLYVHADGTDIIDFGGMPTVKESRHQVGQFLKNRSFIGRAKKSASLLAGSYLHLQVQNYRSAGYASSAASDSENAPSTSHLVRIEDETEHVWLMAQGRGSALPYARLFSSFEDLFTYLTVKKIGLPGEEDADDLEQSKSSSSSSSGSESGSTSDTSPDSSEESIRLPPAKWVDMQINLSDPSSNAALSGFLERLPISDETRESCLFLSLYDSVDVNNIGMGPAFADVEGYFCMTLMCTPVVDAATLDAEEEEAGRRSAEASAAQQRQQQRSRPFSHRRRAPGAEKPYVRVGYDRTRSVMEMRFEAVRAGVSRSSVPEPVPVAILVFDDWVVTIHEKPFAEMDDLLRMIQLHCSPPERSSSATRFNALFTPTMKRRFTAPFVLSTLLQIAVGHHIDSVALAQAVDELGDLVFDIKEHKKDQDEVLQRITAVRRCFGECGADVGRREAIFATLLQPSLANSFLLADQTMREDLENAQAHLWHVQREINDCRDTVAVSNWYHNVALQWKLIRRGNRALRMALLLTEVTNLLYPIVTVQTLYSMNVRVPFEADWDPPSTTLIPFFLLLLMFLLYSFITFRAIRRMIRRKAYQTQLLA